MQVFVVGSPLETAMALDKARLRKQIIECRQILDALNGKKAWSNHPCTLQYKEHVNWLNLYLWCLECYANGRMEDAQGHSDVAGLARPAFHTEEFFDQMKRRLYTKNPEHYKQWAELGTSEDNYYWSPTKRAWLIYRNGKLLETIM